MATESLSTGRVISLTQNVVYALPAKLVYIHSNAALQISNNTGFSATQAVSASTPTLAAGGWVRCTSGTALVSLKAF